MLIVCYPGEAIDATTIEIATSGEFSENGSLEQILHGAITDIDLEMHSMPSNVGMAFAIAYIKEAVYYIHIYV